MRNESPAPQHHAEDDGFLAAVCAGLRRSPKSIPPKYFYDAHGSHLFDLICATPEYYPTRTEIAILETHGAEMAALLGRSSVLVELGSGSAIKTPLLLKHLSDQAVYVPIDICEPHLLQSTRRLQMMFPAMRMQALCADYTQLRSVTLDVSPPRRRAVFFPGSTIGNYAPGEAVRLLRNAAQLCGSDGGMLIGVDRKKPIDILNAAYNDAEGHTAAFNLNLLQRMQRELGALLDPDGFKHTAFYNEALGRIEMHLVSHRKQSIRVDGKSFLFEAGESIHTENSYKYTTQEFEQLARAAGWHPTRHWSDQDSLFDVHYLSLPASHPAKPNARPCET
jgi:L-histidine Nalpha-methyltransferase